MISSLRGNPLITFHLESDFPRCKTNPPQGWTEAVSSDGSSGDAGKRLLKRLLRVLGYPSPRECKVSIVR